MVDLILTISRRLDVSGNDGISNAGAEALATHALSSPACRLQELRIERSGVRAAGRLALLGSVQANTACGLRCLYLGGNTDPDADPAAGARLVSEPTATGGVRVVIAGLSKAEQMMAQALSIGRQLRTQRHVQVFE